MKYMQLFLTFDKITWEDNSLFLYAFLYEFNRKNQREDFVTTIFEDKDIPKYFLKIYLVINEQFLLNKNSQDKSMLPIYFFNQICHTAMDTIDLQSVSTKQNSVKFICQCLFSRELNFTSIPSFLSYFTFSSVELSKFELVNFFVQIIEKILRNNSKAEKQLKKLNFAPFFLKKQLCIVEFLVNGCEHGVKLGHFPEIFCFEIYFSFYIISIDVYNESALSCFNVDGRLIKRLFEILIEKNIGDYSTKHAFLFLEKVSKIDENSSIFLTERFSLLVLLRKYPSQSRVCITKIFYKFCEKNIWDAIEYDKKFFLKAINFYKNYFSKPFYPSEEYILTEFLKRCTNLS